MGADNSSARYFEKSSEINAVMCYIDNIWWLQAVSACITEWQDVKAGFINVLFILKRTGGQNDGIICWW